MRGLAPIATRLSSDRLAPSNLSAVASTLASERRGRLPPTLRPVGSAHRTGCGRSCRCCHVLRCAAVESSYRMPLTRVPAAGWLSDGSAMNAAMISSRVTSHEPIRQQRLGLAEDVGAVLLLLGLGGHDGIADPFQPDPMP